MNLSPKDQLMFTKQKDSFQQIPLDIKMIQLGIEIKGKISIMDKVILLVEYMQLLSQIIFLNSTFTHSKNPGLLYESVLYILKIFNPCSLIPTERNDLLLQSLFAVIICLFAVKVFLISYIALIAFYGKEGNQYIIAFWKWILKRRRSSKDI